MRLIVITQPTFRPHEAEEINELFAAGLQTLHLRKPDATLCEIELLLARINSVYLSRIVLHEHFELARHYPLKGIHLNARNPHPPIHYHGTISSSCHSFDEVRQRKLQCEYVFLSPIFNSISKRGYTANFSAESLNEARNHGIIDHKVIALGGIDKTKIPELKHWNFGGLAVLGDVWQQPHHLFLSHFIELNTLASIS